MSTKPSGELLAVLGAGAALVVCCAAPLLIAAGALSALAAVFTSPWLLAAAGAAAAIAVAVTAAHHPAATARGMVGENTMSIRSRDSQRTSVASLTRSAIAWVSRAMPRARTPGASASRAGSGPSSAGTCGHTRFRPDSLAR